MLAHRRPLAVVEPGAPELAVLHRETERVDQVQACPGIGAQAYDVARVRGDFGLEEDHVEHRLDQAGKR
jgi:hypothetical protein